MTKYKPFSIRNLLNLGKGDSFIAYYAKDDDPENVRFDYEKMTIEDITIVDAPNTALGWEYDILTEEGLELVIRPTSVSDKNSVDMCGRGTCYVFRSTVSKNRKK